MRPVALEQVYTYITLNITKPLRRNFVTVLVCHNLPDSDLLRHIIMEISHKFSN